MARKSSSDRNASSTSNGSFASDDPIAAGFRRWGYLQADLDYFGRIPPMPHSELDSPPASEAKKWREIYCGKVGAEFMHIPAEDRVRWVASKMEEFHPDIDERFILDRLTSAETFERYLHLRYVGAKWFSLEGLTAMIPLLDYVLDTAANNGVELVMIAMSHRGRLNTMHHIAAVQAWKFFAGFEDVDPRSVLGSGDAKYHKGGTGIYKTLSGRELKVHLASNPSHLEAVNPVITGRTRARQERLGKGTKAKVMPIIIHGDAAVAGQGITAETLNYYDLPGFRVGGTLHVIANNLIGFTAIPQALHSSRYATDIFKRIPIPIFHVNAESPNDVARVGIIAAQYRADFQSDAVVDLIGYRRFGHNEVDDPTVTSPALYAKIKAHPTLNRIYAKDIGVSENEVEASEAQSVQLLTEEHEKGRQTTKQPAYFDLPSYWDRFTGGFYTPSLEVPTAVDAQTLRKLGEQLSSTPPGFNLHPKFSKLLAQRRDMAAGKIPVDWGTAEALAFGTLLLEGSSVRLTGQDCRRGTFSHRNAVLYDYNSNEPYIPLCNLDAKQAQFDVYDSILSEAAAVGFEYGFSRDYPEALVCWEAQFGDFVNGAQIIIDQFLSAGEDKWGLLSGLVMLLPHGYEGQGPEHSSARIERFLHLCGEDNIQVCYPSCASQYFHLLRRQVRRRWRKPLIVFTPKSMLRHPHACSPIEEFSSGEYRRIIPDQPQFGNAERVIFASGKIVHELRAERQKIADETTAIIALEQFYPFPEDLITEALLNLPNAQSVVWVQEEPANMGALNFIRPLMEPLLGGRGFSTVKRSVSASPATGSPKAHAMEQETLMKFAFAHYR